MRRILGSLIVATATALSGRLLSSSASTQSRRRTTPHATGAPTTPPRSSLPTQHQRSSPSIRNAFQPVNGTELVATGDVTLKDEPGAASMITLPDASSRIAVRGVAIDHTVVGPAGKASALGARGVRFAICSGSARTSRSRATRWRRQARNAGRAATCRAERSSSPRFTATARAERESRSPAPVSSLADRSSTPRTTSRFTSRKELTSRSPGTPCSGDSRLRGHMRAERRRDRDHRQPSRERIRPRNRARRHESIRDWRQHR